jgi:TetR/AcrR family transcriptional regulator
MDVRSELLAQALRLFTARGYDAVGVQEIVEAAGVTKPTLYHYFGSKRGLLVEVLSGYFSQLTSLVQPAAVYSGDLPQTLEHITGAYFAFARANPGFYRLQLALWFAPPESEAFGVVAGFLQEQHAVVEQVFRLAARDHGNMQGRHQAYAATFTGMLNTYIGIALNGYASLDDALLRQVVRQFQFGIYS